jgi:hypothetical protein
MISLRWEHLLAGLVMTFGVMCAFAGWLAYGARAILVGEHESSLGELSAVLAGQLPIERFTMGLGAALVVIACGLWVIGRVRLAGRGTRSVTSP